MTTGGPQSPHFPAAAAIEAYGNGGFRFAGMSHRGSLLCLPDGIWAWPVVAPSDITAESLAAVTARAEAIDTLLVGTGRTPWVAPAALAGFFRTAGIVMDVMQTGPAIRSYNIMVEERRRVAAALIAVP